MKHGTVWQRHLASCPRAPDGSYAPHRCRGAWAYLVDVGRDGTGKRKQSGKGGYPTKAAARQALHEAVEMLGSGIAVHSLTVGRYLDDWLTGKHALKPKTVAGYRDAIDLYLAPHLGHIPLLELRAHHLDRFYEAIRIGKRGRPLSPSSIRRVHAGLRSALNSAVKRRLIPYNPALHVELKPENPKRPRPWTVEQCQLFLERSDTDRLLPMYHLLIVTGMRRGEVVGLRWSDVDLPDRSAVVVQQITEVRGRSIVSTPKTKRSERVLALDDDIVQALRRHREAQLAERRTWGLDVGPDDLVFAREDGRPLRPEYATRHFQALARAAGLPEIRLHDLRHTSASLALAAGIDTKVVSERLGHATIAITANLYTHVIPRLEREAATKLGDALRAQPRVAVANEMLSRDPEQVPEGGTDEPEDPTTKQAPASVSAGQGPVPSLSQRARPEGLEPPTF